jgi:hypothetical protein
MKKIFIVIIAITSLYGSFLLFRINNTSGQTKSIDIALNFSKKINSASRANLNVTDNSQRVSGSHDEIEPPLVSPSAPALNPLNEVKTKINNTNVTIQNIQVVKLTILNEDGLRPGTFNLKVGVPARIEIYPEVDINGCMSTILIPGLYEEPALISAGETIVMEFTPKEAGEYYFTCAMGIPWGAFNVVL